MHVETALRHLTIRNVPTDLAKALQDEKRRRGTSLNQTVKDLLKRALGVGTTERFENGLGRFAGTWDEADLAEFEAATASFSEIDDELWR